MMYLHQIQEPVSSIFSNKNSVPEDQTTENMGERLANYLTFKARGVGESYKVTDGIYVSPLNKLTLNDFVIVRQLFCSSQHAVGCLECSRLVEFAKLVKEGGIVELAVTYRMVFPHLAYKSDLAVRKVMQLPVCVFRMTTMGHGSEKLYITGKIDGVDYKSFVPLAEKVWQTQESVSRLNNTMLKELCNLASSDTDKLLIKYICCEAQNFSMNKARRFYGFQNFNQQKENINNAIVEMKEIHEVVEELATVKDHAVLRGFGISVEDELCSSGPEGSSSPAEDSENDVEWLSDEDKRDPKAMGGVTCRDVSLDVHVDSESTLEKAPGTASPLPSHDHLLSILVSNNLNWFAFVTELTMLLHNSSETILRQSLQNFSDQLPFLNVTEEEQLKIETSRQAYLASESEKATQESMSDDSLQDDFLQEEYLQDDSLQKLDAYISVEVRKRREKYRRKHARLKGRKIAEARLLKKKVPKGVSRILKRFPNIGKDIEEFVRTRRVGADAWRRTGVLTFDGNVKRGPKVTYKGIQEHLQTKYGTKIAYGTVVQLSVIRNKRRLSAKRYRGVASITCRRARKGFTIKMNPDAHWNTAMYRSLDNLQLKNGTEQLVLNRDDAAGFRLDTTYTHKQHKGVQLLDSPDLSTRMDYLNKYTSVLQTTSYMFLPTSSTSASCIGVVKPHVVYDKNPSQHMADLNMLGKQQQNTVLFQRESDGQKKDVWFI